MSSNETFLPGNRLATDLMARLLITGRGRIFAWHFVGNQRDIHPASWPSDVAVSAVGA
jgi:hypothetical protein